MATETLKLITRLKNKTWTNLQIKNHKKRISPQVTVGFYEVLYIQCGGM
jgi:hypothetical protein